MLSKSIRAAPMRLAKNLAINLDLERSMISKRLSLSLKGVTGMNWRGDE
jgi:hypothetical protein